MREGAKRGCPMLASHHTKPLPGLPPEKELGGVSRNAIESPKNCRPACSRLSGNWTRSKAICCYAECIKRLRYEASRLGCKVFQSAGVVSPEKSYSLIFPQPLSAAPRPGRFGLGPLFVGLAPLFVFFSANPTLVVCQAPVHHSKPPSPDDGRGHTDSSCALNGSIPRHCPAPERKCGNSPSSQPQPGSADTSRSSEGSSRTGHKDSGSTALLGILQWGDHFGPSQT
jgi:hypothetical protein